MSSATSSSFVLFSEEDIKELKSQQDRLVSQASSLAAAVNAAEEHLKQLREKYATSQECLQNLRSLITKASAESATVIQKSPYGGETKDFKKVPSMKEHEDCEIPRIAPGNGKPDAPTLIREVLEMYFSDKVDLDTFMLEQADYSDEPVLCTVYLKDIPAAPLEIWYNDHRKIGGRAVLCAGRQHRFTTVKGLKAAITTALMMEAKRFGKGRTGASKNDGSESESD
jgi:FtsZ-binding cell division protein ZapB